jgi:hypothetical protein
MKFDKKNHFFYNYFSIFIYICTFVAWKILYNKFIKLWTRKSM